MLLDAVIFYSIFITECSSTVSALKISIFILVLSVLVAFAQADFLKDFEAVSTGAIKILG